MRLVSILVSIFRSRRVQPQYSTERLRRDLERSNVGRAAVYQLTEPRGAVHTHSFGSPRTPEARDRGTPVSATFLRLLHDEWNVSDTGPLALHSRLGFVGALEKFIRLPLEEDRRNERTKFDGLVGAV